MNYKTAETAPKAPPAAKNKPKAAGKAGPPRKREKPAPSSAPSYRSEPLRPAMAPLPAQVIAVPEALAGHTQKPPLEACTGLPPKSLPEQPPSIALPEDSSSRRSVQAPRMSLDDPVAVAALNKQAAFIENLYFPMHMLQALGLEDSASITAGRIFLARFRDDAGQADDPVEKVLLDQLIVAHLKVAEMHALATGATNIEFKGLYLNSATKLLSSICLLISTLSSYRSSPKPRRKRTERSS